MIILLTGLPGVGKTTILQDLLQKISGPKQWVVSREMRNSDGLRIGFEASSSFGATAVFAHKTAITSPATIGEYKVDLEVVNALFTDSLKRAIARQDELLVFDEIGRMQMLSPAFEQAVHVLFASNVFTVATIRHGDDWTIPFTTDSQAVVFTIEEGNRAWVSKVVQLIAEASALFRALSRDQQVKAANMLREYVANAKMLQIEKLCKQGVLYTTEGKVAQVNDNTWSVAGRHAIRTVTRTQASDGGFACTCDVFMGTGLYVGNAGECSHIQAVKLFTESA